MTNILYIDTETLMLPLADPYHPRGKLIYVGLDNGVVYGDYPIEYTGEPYGTQLKHIQELVNKADILVLANGKFDLLWLKRYSINFSHIKVVHDVLLIQFILNAQTTPFNSLNDVAAQWGVGQKEDIVKKDYWDNGIDTDKVPEDILRSYLKQDVQLTKQVYQLQMQEVLKRNLMPLVNLHGADLLMLLEMEWNGNKYDVKASRHEAATKLLEIRAIKKELSNLIDFQYCNWGSPDFISQVLYGGIRKYKVKENYLFTYKDGSTKEKTHYVEKQKEFAAIVAPPKQARAKDGYYPTDEATLKKLKATGIAKKIVENLLSLRELEKLVGTYLRGLPKMIRESEWENGTIHCTYNQIRAVTGRLSSTSPNCQNISKDVKRFFVSRFGE